MQANLATPFSRYRDEFWMLMIIPSQTSPGFYMSAVQVFWKLCEKENSLVKSNFSFSHSAFHPFGELSVTFIKFEIVVRKLSVWRSLKFVVWERVK